MPLKIALELSDRDLRYFKRMMGRARRAASKRDEAEIRAGASKMLDALKDGQLSDFIRERLQTLATMIRMLEDAEWNLSGADRRNIVQALAYFAEPEDLIPDRIPGLGYLDDAIMIELVAQELRHDLEAYHDFCDFRALEEKRRRRVRDATVREEWLAPRRQQLHGRMRRRRQRHRASQRSGSGRSPFALW